MKTVKVPKFFHELFGHVTTAIELVLIISFSVVSTLFVFWINREHFSLFSPVQAVVTFILLLDITGGIIANFSYGTNKVYQDSTNSRYLFIALHIQPLIIALTLGKHWLLCFSVWIFTIVSALIVNQLVTHPAQRVIGATFLALGLGLLLQFASTIPSYLLILLVFYMMKVIYSFAVNHYVSREV